MDRINFLGFVEFKKDGDVDNWTVFDTEDTSEKVYERHYTLDYHIMPLETFLEDSKDGYLLNDDGSIAGLLIKSHDGWYGTNAGLDNGEFCEGGDVILDADTLLKFSKKHPIYVNWANR